MTCTCITKFLSVILQKILQLKIKTINHTWTCRCTKKNSAGGNPAYNPSNLFAHTQLVSARHVTEYSPAKTGEYARIFPNFQNCVRCEKDLKDNKDNSLHLGLKYARIFVRGHYLFQEANSFPRAKLEENCELRGTDNVQGQISEHIFAPNGGYCLYYPLNLFRIFRKFSHLFQIFLDIPQL